MNTQKLFKLGAAFAISGYSAKATTTSNPDGFSADPQHLFSSGSGIISSGFGNQSTQGDHGYGHAGGNLLAGSWNKVLNSDSSFAAGLENSLINQEGSFAMGFFNTMNFSSNVLGQANFSFGYDNHVVSGSESIIWGAILIGTENQSSAPDSWMIGKGNVGQTDTITVGTYAQPVSNAAFIVGKGSYGSRSNGLVVLRNGEVQIEGSLFVGGSPVLSQGSANSYLQSQGFVNTSYLSSNGYLKKATGTNASVGTSDFLAVGNNAHATGGSSFAIGNEASASSWGAVSLGDQSVATGIYAIALQGGNAEGEFSFAAAYGLASGKYSLGVAAGWAFTDSAVAIGGYDEVASWANEAGGVGSVAIGGATNSALGDYSYAFGSNSVTLGRHSYSIGYQTRTNAYQIAMGSRNLSSQNEMSNMSNDQWLENGALFELGNGNPTQSNPIVASNAITTLKNGRTTLTNKEWKAHPSTPLADPDSTTDSGGEALVVEGHTRLKGKVIIEQPQGDISMGIYQ